MAEASPLVRIRQLEVVIIGILRGYDPQDLSKECRRTVAELKRELTDARMDIRDAEYADTGEEYRRYTGLAKQRIKNVIGFILVLSQYDMVSAIQVAEITARLEQLVSDM